MHQHEARQKLTKSWTWAANVEIAGVFVLEREELGAIAVGRALYKSLVLLNSGRPP